MPLNGCGRNVIKKHAKERDVKVDDRKELGGAKTAKGKEKKRTKGDFDRYIASPTKKAKNGTLYG